MSRLNHSPGPWKCFHIAEANKIQIETLSGHIVCEIRLYARQRAPAANAHFISAAPDLFECLNNLSKILDEGHLGENLHTQMIRALAKAKGE